MLLRSNRKTVLDYMRDQDILTVSDIARAVQISIPTVKKIIEDFMTKELVKYMGKGNSTAEGGKKPLLYRMNEEYGYVIALHVGPDFIYALSIGLRMQIIDTYYETVTEAVTDDWMVNRLVEIAHTFTRADWAEKRQLINVVIALPGITDASKGTSIYSPHYPQWKENYPFVTEFSKRFTTRVPVFIDCVNRLQAVAEAILGKARGVDNFIIVDAMEEGVGAGIVSDGIMTYGHNHLAGEIGHNIVDPNGPRCICDGVGCFEAMVSKRHILQLIREGVATHPDSMMFQSNASDEATLENLFECARKEDPFAMQLMEKLANWFARGLNSLVLDIDPELIIIQGIFVTAGESFLQMVREKLSGLSLSRVKRDLTIIYSDFKIERGALGAGCFGMVRFFDDQGMYE